MSGAAVRQDVEAGENAFAVARPGGPSPISHTMQGRAQASQRFIVGKKTLSHLRAASGMLKSLGLLRPMSCIYHDSASQKSLPITDDLSSIIWCTHAGVVILLFVAGLVPFSSVLFLLLALFALASCVQYNLLARHEADQGRPGIAGRMPAWQSAERMHRAAILGMMGTFGFANPALHHLMAAHPTRTTMHNLRLSLMNRDFTDAGEHYYKRGTCSSSLSCFLLQTAVVQMETKQRTVCSHKRKNGPKSAPMPADYEMLLQLDQPDGSTAPPSAAVEEEIASLPTYKFKADKVSSTNLMQLLFMQAFGLCSSVQCFIALVLRVITTVKMLSQDWYQFAYLPAGGSISASWHTGC